MEVKTFNNLTEEEKQQLFHFINDTRIANNFDCFEAMCGFFDSTIMDNGCSHFSLWDRHELTASLGVISKDAALRNEIFIVAVQCREEYTNMLTVLLDRAFQYCSAYPNARYLLGVSACRPHLEPAVRQYGFTQVYQLLVLDYQGQPVHLPEQDNRRFLPLSSENKKDFQQVHNDAFLHSPNGGLMDEEELDETLADYADTPELAGVYYPDGKAAGMYMLKLKGNIGWIDTIGVDPKFQGKGLGKMLLQKSISLLQQQAGTDHVKLTVMSSNDNAVGLYLRNGFVLEKVESTWFERRA